MAPARAAHARVALLAVGLFLALLAAPGIAPSAATAAPPSPAPRDDARRLEPAERVERDLAGGETHHYEISSGPGQFLHLVADQRGIDVVVTLAGPDGMALAETDSPNGTQGPEPVMVITDRAGPYRLEVRSPDRRATAGRYELRVVERRPATAEDTRRLEVHRLFLEAERLRADGSAPSLRKAAEGYQSALASYRASGDVSGEGEALTNLGIVHWSLGELEKALDHYTQALSPHRSVGNRRREAETLNNIGLAHWSAGEPQRSLPFYDQALALWRATGNRSGEATTLNNVGLAYKALGESRKALEVYHRALSLHRAVGERLEEATTLNNIGVLHAALGEKQKALDHYLQALPLRRATGDVRGEAVTLDNIGGIFNLLGEGAKALFYHHQALALSRTRGDRRQEAIILENIGVAHRARGEMQRALEHYTQALALSRAVKDRRREAVTLNQMGLAYDALGERGKALEHYGQALAVRRDTGDRRGEAYTLVNIGMAHRAQGDLAGALEHYAQARPLMEGVGDREGQAHILYQVARVERDRHDLDEARRLIEAALGTIESLRNTITSQDLRASYFATVQQHHEFYIDLLMRLHGKRPAAGLDALALEASERARARSLVDILAEAGADIRQGVDPSLLEREGSLRAALSAKAERQTRLLSGRHTPEQAAAVAREIEGLAADSQQVQAQIRATSPRYAALIHPRPSSVEEIQREVLDEETTLLEYALGEERSFLWQVTPASVTSYELPGRAEIEAAARRFHELAKADATAEERARAAHALSEMLLAPVAGRLGSKRLAIVTDGALHYVPFAALPLPSSALPLITEHEIVSLPSASTLAVLRRETDGRPPASRAVAVLADPVFERDDPRVRSRSKGAPARGSALVGGPRLARLLGSRREAAGILALVPENERRQALDFEASRATATSGELADYRMVHFATHGLLDSVHPELSGVVLSLVDEKGEAQDGFLRLHEIYNLKLPVELVVLSACQTGLGKEIRGEGLVGLTRGFMYAGAPRVVASLWKVDDRATSELMKRFYQGALGPQRLRPAAALREAQIAMYRQKRWQDPYYWAAFVLQGEWN